MFSKEKFGSCIKAICEIYGIKETHDNYPSKRVLKLLFECLERTGFDDNDMQVATFNLINKAERKDTFKIPLPKEFYDAAGKKQEKIKTIEEIAAEQAELVFSNLERMKGIPRVFFDDPVTSYTVDKSFGGISQFCDPRS